MADELHYLTIAQAARAIADGSLSPVELCEAYRSRIDETNPRLRAFLTRTDELAAEQAAAAEREIARNGPKSPLHGIPYALKDVYDTAGLLTTGHSAITADRVPISDSVCAARLSNAGGVLLGKLATHEFATGGPSYDLPWPPARNPWRLDRFPGGSSSGAAAAVAAGLVPGALGSDTGGSIRLPAAYCGLVGLKPTYGRVSKRGALPLAWTLDTCGPLAWTVEDAAILLQIIAGYDPHDPGSLDVPVPDFGAGLGDGIKGLRIGVVRHLYERDVQSAPSVVAAMEETYDVLKRLGATLVEVELPSLATFQACYRTIVMPEAYSIHEHTLRTRAAEYGAQFRYRIFPGALVDASDYVSALRLQRAFREQVLEALDSVDALVTASIATPAPVQHRMTAEGGFRGAPLTMPFNIAQCPAISVCNGFSDDGLPLSMQVVGRPLDEARIVQIAAAYEDNTPWRQTRPGLVPGDEDEFAPEPYSEIQESTYAALAQQAGLTLDGPMLAELDSAMRATDELLEQVRVRQPYSNEPGPTFSLRSTSDGPMNTSRERER